MTLFEKLLITASLFLITLWLNRRMMHGMRPLIEKQSTTGRVLDLRLFGYTADEVRRVLTAYGPSLRARYAETLRTADVPYAVAYGAALHALLWLLAHGRSHPSLLLAVPWLATMFDTGENLALATLCRTFPEVDPRLVRRASACTTGKWVVIGVAVLLALFLVLDRIR